MFYKILILAFAVSSCAMADFINGDFSTGNLSGWTYYLTANGDDDFGDVASFDTTGTGASLAARFEVGQLVFINGGPAAGAGIRQSLLLQPGLYNLTANIAATGTDVPNSSGGQYTAFLGSTPIDSYDFGAIPAFSTERNSQSVQVSILTAGTYSFSFQFARPFRTTFDTPDNYIDNIKLTLVTPYGVPEPSEWGLAAAGLGVATAATRLRRR